MVTTTTKTIDDLKLVRLNEENFDEVMKYLMQHFIPNEPTARAIGMTPDEGWKLTEGLVRRCFKFPYSCCFKNEKNEIAAIRLAAIIERPKTNGTNSESKNDKMNEESENSGNEMAKSAIELDKLLSALRAKMWDLLASSIEKLLEIVIISTHERYTRRGLMKKLMRSDLTEQKRDGIQGAITEATASNSQKLFAKLGFQVLHQINHNELLDNDGKRIFECSDSTNCAQLLYQNYVN